MPTWEKVHVNSVAINLSLETTSQTTQSASKNLNVDQGYLETPGISRSF